MKIVITGSYGQLGNEIAGISKTLPNWHFLFTDVDTLNIVDENEVKSYFEKHQPDYVVNCAAYTAVDKAESDIENAEKVNALAPKILGKYTRIHGAKLIHVSTDYVFEGKGPRPYKEDDKVNPQNAYGRTKLQGELNAMKENPDTVLIRTSWLYSSFGNNFVKTMMRLVSERDSLKVVCDQIGTPTYAGDFAAVILEIIQRSENNAKMFVPGIYHYSNEGVASWYDFAKAIFEITETECNVFPVLSEAFPTPAQRPNYSVLDKSKIKDTYNVDIPYWKDSLKICIEKLLNKD